METNRKWKQRGPTWAMGDYTPGKQVSKSPNITPYGTVPVVT
jgi:hypothetical protein